MWGVCLSLSNHEFQVALDLGVRPYESFLIQVAPSTGIVIVQVLFRWPYWEFKDSASKNNGILLYLFISSLFLQWLKHFIVTQFVNAGMMINLYSFMCVCVTQTQGLAYARQLYYSRATGSAAHSSLNHLHNIYDAPRSRHNAWLQGSCSLEPGSYNLSSVFVKKLHWEGVWV